jgi:hypothetical protein
MNPAKHIFHNNGIEYEIDCEVQKHNLSIVFVKFDIEGYELDLLRGVIKTLKAQYPILSVSSYFNSEPSEGPVFLDYIGGYGIKLAFIALL